MVTGNFKVPLLPPTVDLPVFNWSSVTVKELTRGNGAFAAVYIAEHRDAVKVVIKLKCKTWDSSGKKFIKEARIMKDLMHENVVAFEAICLNPLAFLLEYCKFDFTKYGSEQVIHTLDEYLQFIDNFEADSFEKTFTYITADIVCGLRYLHSKKIAHRDLKPSNVLVTDTNNEKKIIICKLSHFGEARSVRMQTMSRVSTNVRDNLRGKKIFCLFIKVCVIVALNPEAKAVRDNIESGTRRRAWKKELIISFPGF